MYPSNLDSKKWTVEGDTGLNICLHLDLWYQDLSVIACWEHFSPNACRNFRCPYISCLLAGLDLFEGEEKWAGSMISASGGELSWICVTAVNPAKGQPGQQLPSPPRACRVTLMWLILQSRCSCMEIRGFCVFCLVALLPHLYRFRYYAS